MMPLVRQEELTKIAEAQAKHNAEVQKAADEALPPPPPAPGELSEAQKAEYEAAGKMEEERQQMGERMAARAEKVADARMKLMEAEHEARLAEHEALIATSTRTTPRMEPAPAGAQTAEASKGRAKD